MSGAALFGLALISASKLVFALAVISQVSHWWFLSRVEKLVSPSIYSPILKVTRSLSPHMQKLYGSSLRQEAGLTKVVKNVALKNAKLLESRAGKHAPEIRRVAREVIGTFDKVYEETAEAVKEFLPKPTLSEVMQDTKVLLQHSREKLVIRCVLVLVRLVQVRILRVWVFSAFSRITNDSGLDKSKYHIEIKNNRVHVGEPIHVQWKAPADHSKRDWIGIYRVSKQTSLGNFVYKLLINIRLYRKELINIKQ